MKILRPLLLAISLLFLTNITFAQTSRGFSYQAVARDASGNIQANTIINLEFSILDNTQAQIYEENHIGIATNDFGLFALVIGEGTSSQNFGAIDWSSGKHYLAVTLNGLPIDTTELAAVPYAKVATDMKVTDLTDVSISTISNGDVLKWDGSAWVSAQDEVNDADADPTNEIQALSLLGDSLKLSLAGGGVRLTDLDATNELQSLSLNGNTLSISGGNSISIPTSVYTAGNGISINGQVISNTGDTNASDDITVNSVANGDVTGSFNSLSVRGIQGRTVSSAIPISGQVLKFVGGAWTPSTDNIGTPIWTQSGNNIYYSTGRVGIGTNSPSNSLDVEQATGSGAVGKFEHRGSFVSNQNLLELRVPSGASNTGQVLEVIKGNTITAAVDVDGDASFKTVKAEDNLGSTATPETGTMYANSLPIAYGYISSSGSILQGYGISSVTRTNNGEYEVVLRKTPVGTPVVVATSSNNSPDDEVITAASFANSTFLKFNIREGGGLGSGGTDSNFYFVVYGNTQ